MNSAVASPLSVPVVATVARYAPAETVNGTVKAAVSKPPEIEHDVDQDTP